MHQHMKLHSSIHCIISFVNSDFVFLTDGSQGSKGNLTARALQSESAKRVSHSPCWQNFINFQQYLHTVQVCRVYQLFVFFYFVLFQVLSVKT